MLSEEEGKFTRMSEEKECRSGADAANLAENFMNSREHFVGPKKSIFNNFFPPTMKLVHSFAHKISSCTIIQKVF
jgi:hypothetical protein